MLRTLSLVTVCAGLGCGGGSNVDGSKLLLKLTASDISALCDYEASVTTARTVNCVDGSSVIVSTNKSTCEAAYTNIDPTCTATAGDAESCYVAFDADPCSSGGGACTAVLSCENL
jgi:hypothetical protein